MRRSLSPILIWLVLSLFFAACSSGEGEVSATPEPQAVLTAAAETAAVQMTELANPPATSTATADPGSEIPAPTASLPSITDAAPGEVTPQATVATGGIDLAEFWADVTIPDGTDFNPGDPFTKIWKLRNSGTNTWTPEYSLAFFTGDQMSAPGEVPISANVAPGDTTDVAIDMVAPDANGSYTGYWKMQNPAGEFFEYSVFVMIDVLGGSQPAQTSVPPPSGSGEVSNVSIRVDNASPDECPYTFTFTATFSLDEPATVSYRMEAGSDTPGFTFNLPGEFTGSFDAGSQAVTYYLQIEDSMNGWAQFHVLSPNDVTSSPTNFSLSCGP